MTVANDRLRAQSPDRLAYSMSEFAEKFGCSRQHVQNLITRGELPSVKLGRRRFIPASVVDELLASALTKTSDPS